MRNNENVFTYYRKLDFSHDRNKFGDQTNFPIRQTLHRTTYFIISSFKIGCGFALSIYHFSI